MTDTRTLGTWLAVPSGFSLTSLVKKSASIVRLFGSLIADGIPVVSLILVILPSTYSEPWGPNKDKSGR